MSVMKKSSLLCAGLALVSLAATTSSAQVVKYGNVSPTGNYAAFLAGLAGLGATPTTITFSGSDPKGPDGNAGSGPATVVYSATADALKGGKALATTRTAGSSASYLLNTEGITTFTFHTEDVAGNVEADSPRIVRLDKTQPVGTCPTASTDWFATNQTFTCTASDPLSGLADQANGVVQPAAAPMR